MSSPEDVRRYLGGLPVNARGGQLAYRAGKFVRRRKLGIVAAGVFAIMLTGGSSLRSSKHTSLKSSGHARNATSTPCADSPSFDVPASRRHQGSAWIDGARELWSARLNSTLGTLATEAHRSRAASARHRRGLRQSRGYSGQGLQPEYRPAERGHRELSEVRSRCSSRWLQADPADSRAAHLAGTELSSAEPPAFVGGRIKRRSTGPSRDAYSGRACGRRAGRDDPAGARWRDAIRTTR